MKNKSTPVRPASIPYGAVVGQVLLRRRQFVAMQQSAMAEALGVTQSAYSRIETGQSTMTIAQLRMAASKLGLQPGALLAEVDSYVAKLNAEGVAVTEEKSLSSSELLIGLGILAAIFAASR